jgi:hypothetical protein
MIQLQQDLKNPRVYAFIVAGTFIGIALVMGATYFGYSNLGKVRQNNINANNQSEKDLPPGTAPVVKDFLKDVDPTKPYVDANGTEHPPIGVAAAPYDPNVKVEHPPAGGPVPVPPKAPAVPKAPVVPATTPVTSGTSTR